MANDRSNNMDRVNLVPTAPGTNPFKQLPFPSPGDRIKADDFKVLSQGLKIIHETYILSSSLFGSNFKEARLVLASQQYEVKKAMTVFGTQTDNPDDESMDNRKVIQIVPVEPGEKQVAVILTEAVETRRLSPNLLGKSYKEASDIMRNVLGDITSSGTPMDASQLVGLPLSEAKEALLK